MFEFLMRLKGYNIKKAFDELVELDKLSFKEFERWQSKKKWEIVKFHFYNNKFYKSKVGNVLPNNWADLPVLHKSDYQSDLKFLISKEFSFKNTYVSNTSGSSGHPFFFIKDKDCHSRVWAFWKKRYHQLGLTFDSKEARLYGHVSDTKTRYFEYLKDIAMNRFRFNVFDLSDTALGKYVNIFKSKKFDYMYGYTQTITIFCKYLIKNEIVLNKICPTLKLVIVTSELCSDVDRDIIKKATGVAVFDEYGASEVGYLASQCKNGTWHIIDENVYIENDKNNNIIVTDLFNKAQPFIRYNLGDIGIIDRISKCNCGSNRTILKNFQGRTNDIIKLPNGKISPGFTFYYISRSMLESFILIKEFVIIQTQLDHFIFKVVSDKEITTKERDKIQKIMDYYLCEGLTFKVQRVKRIERPPSGKIKHFHSEL